MKNIIKHTILAVCLVVSAGVHAQQAEVWLTDVDQNKLFQKQSQSFQFDKTGSDLPVIAVNERETYQSIDGFGYALTGGSAMHIIRMSATARAALLRELFGVKGNEIGTSYIRLSIGASDLNEKVFSYNDLPTGEIDTLMKKFDLGEDRKDVIPVMKEILKINPKIKIMGSPWSPPVWMKTNGDTRGGSLKPEYYAAYARYFVRYVQDMKKEGIVIDAITVQNEPLHPGNNPSLLMLAPETAEFVKNHLGPAFKKASIKTKIIVYDHNCDKPEYPISILNDPEAKKYIDGSAFHLYGGTIDAMSKVHDAHPDRHLYFTEQWVGAPGNMKRDIGEHISKLIIGASRNWSRTVIEWNLASDPQWQPHTDRGGCDRCLGAITIDKDNVKKNPAWYIIAHAAKYVRPGSVRIGSNTMDSLPNVAFRTPDKKTVLIVMNKGKEATKFSISSNDKQFVAELNPGAVATYIW
ncbi:glucosylceramidase [Terrimonas sp. NA20]|uniref:Glucosylceramidase n=1 Tax=Terrimonas ginsenosidimutans TaxID=2908004 RepID=A0ABS9KNV3_9BACT|nr:glycoside hydrolase family 30 beta sandwich domain-containing protein [Terrimonas ginsenosidimutans]MCG2614012.1 glucosylceramidase [Terrimonas ginsenosidimutans]